MNNLAFFLFIIGAVLITIGVMENNYKNKPQKIIEYRFIPRNLYDEQMNPTDLKNTFKSMFSDNIETSNTYNLI